MVPNLLSLSRLPLAALYFYGGVGVRLAAIGLAFLTDILDGWVARRWKQVSPWGTLLDPLTDKFFVSLALFTLLQEDKIDLLSVSLFLCRDYSVLLFGIWLFLRGSLFNYQFRAIWCGKVSTFLQLVVLFTLTLDVHVPGEFYAAFLILGLLALFELYFIERLRSWHHART